VIDLDEPPTVPAAAIGAWITLQAAVAAIGAGVPCTGPDAPLWTSEKPGERAAAADRCVTCPAIDACAVYALLAGERSNVWSGLDRAGRRRPHR
jgi:Transcription factor WhiB